MNSLKKGFTLVELLIVIAILAVLAAAVVIVLNPA
ncbi:MAG: prepilin-type N-terminal cleavage/methylation domain-containing protein, partial [Candidatus Colwellbacteria bacterium]|nr:prepilin-type N-terminal cleavage/methylation domain-containing protein [Candidatus Colwellbacteria bacterium]